MGHHLGDSSENLTFSTSEELLQISLEMVQQARKEIKIFSWDLDNKIYDQQELVRSFTNFAIASRHTKLQILVQNPENIIQQGHRLVETSRRLTSSISILCAGADFKDYSEAFMLIDDYGIIHKPIRNRYDGTANFNSPLKNKKYLEIFQTAWAGAQEDDNIRQLNI